MKKMTHINYEMDFHRFNQHLVDVTLEFAAQTDTPVLWLPSWLAGSYLMREFARNITAVVYQINGQSEIHRADKITKSEWQLTEVKLDDTIKVTYEVYCYDLSVRTAYLDSQRLFGNFSSLALAVNGQEQATIAVSLLVPNAFSIDKKSLKIACGLPVTQSNVNKFDEGYISYTMQAPSYEELIDYPFEIAEQTEFSFATLDNQHNSINHRFFISGHHTVNVDRLKLDLQGICQAYNTWLEDTPFNEYTFMTFASGNDYGGLEHINSTALVTPRADLPTHNEQKEPNDNYQRYLGLCSHEYFHSWWVKTVRPDVMMNVDLRKEAYTPLLWVFEGFTSYIDDFMLQASGVVSKESYLKLLTAQINRYNQTAGRDLQSVAESSFDAWIKLYRGDENTGNAGVSYYNKGALVALCLDLLILKETAGKKRLFDVVKVFYRRAKNQDNRRYGMTDANLAEIISDLIDAKVWQDFYQKYVIGLETLPVNEMLSKQGVSIQSDAVSNIQPWGMVVTETSNGLKINKINRDSVASTAGLSAKDVIIAIDGLKANKSKLTQIASAQNHHKKSISCHAFRRDELMTFEVPAQTASEVCACPSLDKVVLKIADIEAADVWLDALK